MSKFGDLLGGKTPAPAPAAPAQPTPVAVPSEPAEAIAPDPIVVEEVVEESVETLPYESDVSIDEMSKDELEDYGRTLGIELDRRHSRRKLVRELKEHLTNS
jgi:GTPase Era involved in 16S rRNA processing